MKKTILLVCSFVIAMLLAGCVRSEISTTPFTEEQLMMLVYETNGGCDLPCYWGITPGKTSWESAAESLSSIGELFGPVYNDKTTKYGAIFGESGWKLEVMSAGFFVKDDIVIAITTRYDRVRLDLDYSLSGLLEELGVPEEIWIRLVTETQTDQPYYYMVLRYPSKGLYVEWNDDTKKIEENLSICPQAVINRVSHAPWLVLWDPEEKAPFRQFGLTVLGDDLGKMTDEYQLLGDISADQMTNEAFFEIYSTKGVETCISVMPVEQ